MTVVPFCKVTDVSRDPADAPKARRIASTKTLSAAGCPEGGGAEPGGTATAPPRVRLRRSYERAAEAIGDVVITLARLALDALVSAARAVQQRLRGRR